MTILSVSNTPSQDPILDDLQKKHPDLALFYQDFNVKQGSKPDLMRKKRKALNSTRKKYISSLKTLKKRIGCKDLSEFGNRKMAEEYWRKAVVAFEEKRNFNGVISALLKYAEVTEIEIPRYISHRTSGEFETTTKQDAREKLRSKIIAFLMKDFPKIYDCDLSDYSDDEYIRERDRFCIIHFFFCGMRVSEVVASLVSDVTIIEAKYRAVVVRSRKTNKIFNRVIKEKKYWDCRDRYVKLLQEKDKIGPIGRDYLFPVESGGSPFSTSRVHQVVSGFYHGYNTKKGVSFKKGITEIVWGQKFWTHIFRHMRTNDLLDYLTVEAVKQWRNDENINTTMLYADKDHINRQMIRNLENKSERDWA